MASGVIRSRRAPLAVVLAAVIVLLVTLSTGAAILIQWHMLRQQTVEVLRARADRGMDGLEERLHAVLAGGEQAVFGLAQLVRTGVLDPGNPDAIELALESVLGSHSQLDRVSVLLPDFRQLSVKRHQDAIEPTRVRFDPDDQDLLDELQSIDEDDGFEWRVPGKYSIYESDNLHVILPVRQRDQEIFYFSAGITLTDLSRYLGANDDDIDVVTFAIRDGNEVVAYSKFADDDDPSTVERVDTLNDPVLSRLEATPPLPGFEGRPNGVVAKMVQTSAGQYIAIDKEIRAYGDDVWKIGAYTGGEALDPLVRALSLAYTAGLVTIAVAILFAILVGRMLARPIRRNTERTAMISQLDLDRVPPLPPSRIVEFNNQASAFNSMLTSLKAFETYVPKALVRRIMASGEEQLENEERELAIMFTDIVGFSTLSESIPPRELGSLLNEIFKIQGTIIEKFEGTIDKYMGDGLMAFWGAPERRQDRRGQACRAALRIREAYHEFNRSRAVKGEIPIMLRIGLHYGMTLVGNIGSADRVNYTVVGDSVNVAQRLEQQARVLEDDPCVVIAISDEVVRGLSRAEFALKEFGSVTVKGRQQPLRMYSLQSLTGSSSPIKTTSGAE